MPTPSEITVEPKDTSIIQNEKISIESSLETQDIHQKKKQVHQSPRRKNNINRNLNMQNRRNQGYHNKKINDNNNKTVFKTSSSIPQLKNGSNLNGLMVISGQQPPQQHQDTNKKPQKVHRTTAYKQHQQYNNQNANMHYELLVDAKLAPGLDNDFMRQQQTHSPGDPLRKYSKSYLHEVGYNMTTSPKQMDDLSLRLALGDNSSYYSHLFTYNNSQMIMQQQQQQLQHQPNYHQSWPRYPNHQAHMHQRIYRNQQANYSNVYDQDLSVPCHCPQPASQQRNNNMQYYHHQNSPTYQNKREFRSGDNNKKNHRNYGNNIHHNSNNNHREYIEKSQNLNENDSRNRKNSNHSNQSENHTFRSLSPTPPNSSKSSSPGVHEKETNEDAESNASGTSSVQEYFNKNGGNSKLTPVKTFSSSAPLLVGQDYHYHTSTRTVNNWIDSNKYEQKFLHNGHSQSAEDINKLATRDNHQYHHFKRPPSMNGNKRAQILKPMPYENLDPYELYKHHCETSESRIEPPSLYGHHEYDPLSIQMWEEFQLHQQTRETYRSKIEIWKALNNSLNNLPLFHQYANPKWGLFMVGSTISGFGSDCSDVDMCLVMKGVGITGADPRNEAIMTLNGLMSHLQSNRIPFQSFSLINAKVPILRFRDATNKIEVDLNFNNCVGVRNTHLLCHYSQLDWRIRPLALVVKLWAQFHNINDARSSTISSYSLVLMVIHYLQYAVKPAVLPCLHHLMPDKFKVLHDITTINMVENCGVNWKSENRQTLGELFFRFLDYYSNFDYAKNAISVRTGGVLPIDECKNVKTPKNDPNHWQTLCIEEPFDLTNTARSVYDPEVFKRVQSVFTYSFFRLREGLQLDSIFKDPLFTTEQQQQMNQMKYLNMSNGHVPVTSVLNDVKS